MDRESRTKLGYEEGFHQGKQWTAHMEGSGVYCATTFSYQGGGPVSCKMEITTSHFLGIPSRERFITSGSGNMVAQAHLRGGDNTNGIFIYFSVQFFVDGGCVGSASLSGWTAY